MIQEYDLIGVKAYMFKEGIHKSYLFEFFIEDLPMWGHVGDATDEDSRRFQDVSLSASAFFARHNGDQIVAAKVSTDVSVGEAVLLVFGATAAAW